MVVCFECHKLSQCKADKYNLQTALGHMGLEMSFPRKIYIFQHQRFEIS